MPDDRGNPAGPSVFTRWLDTLIPAAFETNAELARAVGVAESTILRWRRGEVIPSVPRLLKLSKATGTSTDLLLKIAGYEEPK